MELIELRNVCKTYYLGEVDVPVLKGVSFTVGRGELVASWVCPVPARARS